MKILHIISSMQTGGAEKMLIDIVKYQVLLGNAVEVFVIKKSGGRFEEKLEKFCKVTYGNDKSLYSL